MTREQLEAPQRGVLRFAGFRPLRHRNFAVYWSAALVSNVGSWMQTVAVGALVTDLTGQARWTGLVAAAAFLPIGIFSPIGGALADRLDRRRLMIWTTVAEIVITALLAVLTATGHATPAVLTLTVFAGGSVAALGFPSYQAMLPDLVGPDDLLGAAALGAVQFNFGRIIGPALAGLTVYFGSYTWAFAINAASFGAVVVALLVIRVPSPTVAAEHGLMARIHEGARGAWAEPGCRLAIILITIVGLTASPFIGLIPAIVQVLFDAKPSATSVLVTAQGVGAVVGALALADLAERIGRRRLLVIDLVALCAVLTLYASAPTLAWATAAIALVGMSYVGVLSGLATVVQLRAPAELRARIISLYFVGLGVVYPIGAALQGTLADRYGLRQVTAGGAVTLAAIVGGMALFKPRVFDALEEPTATRE